MKSMKSVSDSFDWYMDVKYNMESISLWDFQTQKIFKHHYPVLFFDFILYMTGYRSENLSYKQQIFLEKQVA